MWYVEKLEVLSVIKCKTNSIEVSVKRILQNKQGTRIACPLIQTSSVFVLQYSGIASGRNVSTQSLFSWLKVGACLKIYNK